MAAAQAVSAFERLAYLDTIKINQQSYGYNGNNYTVLGDEEVLFNLCEDVPDTCCRGGSRRPFVMDGEDNTGRKVFSFFHPRTWKYDKVKLLINEELVSVIRMQASCMTPIFRINDAHDNPILRLKGRISRNAVFELQTNTKETIGAVQKKFRGWKKELFSYNDDYIITFPADLAVHLKIAVIAACIFIDFRFFEGK